MRVGDMVRVYDCENISCTCFWCGQKSNRIGVIIQESLVAWVIWFDVGPQDVDKHNADDYMEVVG